MKCITEQLLYAPLKRTLCGKLAKDPIVLADWFRTGYDLPPDVCPACVKEARNRLPWPRRDYLAYEYKELFREETEGADTEHSRE